MSAVDPARRARAIGDLPAGQRAGSAAGACCSRRRFTATYPVRATFDYDARHHPEPHRRRDPWPAPRGPTAPRRAAATEPTPRPTGRDDGAEGAHRPAIGEGTVVRAREERDRRDARTVGLHRTPSEQSFRPINVREDLAAVPWIATHTHALWIPVAITVGSDGRDRRHRGDGHSRPSCSPIS